MRLLVLVDTDAKLAEIYESGETGPQVGKIEFERDGDRAELDLMLDGVTAWDRFKFDGYAKVDLKDHPAYLLLPE